MPNCPKGIEQSRTIKLKASPLIPFHVNSDTYESCRDAKFRVSTGLYLYQGFCETALQLPESLLMLLMLYVTLLNFDTKSLIIASAAHEQ
ncbi:hypothetical protein NIES4075_09740 [Tolypothrix sp. NIES-4075]|uniref:hypothetical protein n=1 Tax=Tolypothrix sp. NIES-4075 TaxID=2005459 RepID=UPI000B6D5979|nr:hypothetical protein [Tolypothrix sp. NIES-4075]GAX40012.1 hypothetical protein NIES4075_09740 [Tolypothrix sp. NIES-4075]